MPTTEQEAMFLDRLEPVTTGTDAGLGGPKKANAQAPSVREEEEATTPATAAPMAAAGADSATASVRGPEGGLTPVTAIQGTELVAAETSPSPTPLATQKLPEWGVGEGWLAEYERIARRVAAASVLPEALKADARNVLAVALAGRELGLGFMEATRQIHIIKGQTALSAELKLALAKRDGLVIDSVDESNGCRIEAHRKDTGEKGAGEFTPDDKKTAGLHGSGWDNYPKDLYWARAVTRLVRRLAPDAKGASFRSIEELSEDVEE